MPSIPKEDWQPCLWSKNQFLCKLPCSLGKKNWVLQSQKQHLISYSTLLYKIMKCHQLSEVPACTFCVWFVPDSCRSSSMAGQQPGATGKHLEHCCQLIPANSCLQHIFLKGLTISDCTSVVTEGSSHQFLQCVTSIVYSYSSLKHSCTFFMCCVLLHLSVSSFWICGFSLD